MIDTMQDEDLAKADLRNHERLVQQRQPWEATYQEVDARFPNGAGGFNGTQPGAIRGARNYDATHITGNQRFAAAGVAITTPEETGYIKVSFLDEDLMKIPAVKEWCEYAGKRLYAIRHAMHTGFVASANEDWDQLGRYGTSAVWQEARPWGMVYRTLHLSETWIDVDFCGLVDTVHRCFERSARQLEDFFGKENLTPKMRDALARRIPSSRSSTWFARIPVGTKTGWIIAASRSRADTLRSMKSSSCVARVITPCRSRSAAMPRARASCTGAARQSTICRRSTG